MNFAACIGNFWSVNPSVRITVKRATDGSVGGAALHHAVVPTEGRAARGITAAENGNPNAHSMTKHGSPTTREQQRERATAGKAPDGTTDRKLRDASRWLRNVDHYDGLEVAKRRREERIRLDPNSRGKRVEIEINFDNPVGEGYLKGTDNLMQTNRAIFRFDENGDLITSYPVLNFKNE